MPIFRKRVSAVVVADNKLLGFNAIDPHDQRAFFFVPGGAIEPNESLEAATIRETKEETGYTIKLTNQSALVSRYPFFWNGQWFDCETTFFQGVLANTESNFSGDAAYHKGVQWVPSTEIENIFSYSEPIKNAIQHLIRYDKG